MDSPSWIVLAGREVSPTETAGLRHVYPVVGPVAPLPGLQKGREVSRKKTGELDRHAEQQAGEAEPVTWPGSFLFWGRLPKIKYSLPQVHPMRTSQIKSQKRMLVHFPCYTHNVGNFCEPELPSPVIFDLIIHNLHQ